jgi:hypothetical protein
MAAITGSCNGVAHAQVTGLCKQKKPGSFDPGFYLSCEFVGCRTGRIAAVVSQ